MTNKRTIVIGDIHGCIDELDDLLQIISFKPNQDDLYSVGDVIGKGPESLKVLKELKRLNASIVRGNHEDKLLRLATLPFNSLQKEEQKYIVDLGTEFDFWIKEIRTWSFYLRKCDHRKKEFVIVHAGLEPFKKRLSEMSPIVLTRVRNWPMLNSQENKQKDSNLKPWFNFIDFDSAYFPKLIIFGHWAEKGLTNLECFKGLDSGCVYGKELTAYCVEEDRFYSTKSRKIYCPIK